MRVSQRILLTTLMATLFARAVFWGAGHEYLKRREARREIEVGFSARQLGEATEEYSQDNRGHFPDAGRWEQELMPYLGAAALSILHPPAPIGGTTRRFALNLALSGKSWDAFSDPINTPLFFESISPKPSASDNMTSTPAAKDGGTRFVVVYADGHYYTQPPEWKEWARQNPNEAGAMLVSGKQAN